MENRTVLAAIAGLLVIALFAASSYFVIAGISKDKPTTSSFLSGQALGVFPQQSGISQGITLETEATLIESVSGGKDAVLLSNADDASEEDDEDGSEEDEIKIDSTNARITEEQAKSIALQKVGGRVTDIDTDREKGRDAYEVEIRKDGREADVLVDMGTGEVLAVEWEDEEDDD